MDYENYMELYESVYFFNRIQIHRCNDNDLDNKLLDESIYKAVTRILVVNKLLDYNGSTFVMTNEHKEKHRYILENIINKTQNEHYAKMFSKAMSESQFFFDSISDLEYEIYSRYNFPITFETGNEAVKHVDLSNKRVLELGGNSGGLATAVVTNAKNCRYTVVDTKIPCMIGNEFKELNNVNIAFIESNVFDLTLPNESCDYYDYIVIMNLLHDFDDTKCADILRNCIKYCDSTTKFLIIEDILTGEFEPFEPKEAIMHGLRLSVECRGGKQRTADELARLFLNVKYKREKAIKLSNVHTMMVMAAM